MREKSFPRDRTGMWVGGGGGAKYNYLEVTHYENPFAFVPWKYGETLFPFEHSLLISGR